MALEFLNEQALTVPSTQMGQSVFDLIGSVEEPQPTQMGQAALEQLSMPQQAPAPQQQARSVPEATQSVMDKVANFFSDPVAIAAMNTMQAGFGGTQEQFQQAQSAYSQRLQEKQAGIAAKEKEERAQQTAQRNQYLQALYRRYTPESVRAYQESGSDADLVALPSTAGSNIYDFNFSTGYKGNKETGEVTKIKGFVKPKSAAEIKLASDVEKAEQKNVKAYNTVVAEIDATEGQYEELMAPFKDEKGNWIDEDEVPFALTGRILGGGKGELPLLGEKTGWVDEENREKYLAAVELNKQVQIGGVEEARKAGASGINTPAEAKTYFSMMPELDFSSSKNLINSLKRVDAYTKKWNADKIREAQAKYGIKPEEVEKESSTQPESPYATTGDFTSSGGIKYSVRKVQ